MQLNIFLLPIGPSSGKQSFPYQFIVITSKAENYCKRSNNFSSCHCSYCLSTDKICVTSLIFKAISTVGNCELKKLKVISGLLAISDSAQIGDSISLANLITQSHISPGQLTLFASSVSTLATREESTCAYMPAITRCLLCLYCLVGQTAQKSSPTDNTISHWPVCIDVTIDWPKRNVIRVCAVSWCKSLCCPRRGIQFCNFQFESRLTK